MPVKGALQDTKLMRSCELRWKPVATELDLVSEQALRDARVPAARGLRLQQAIAELALQLVQRGCLEPFAVARTKHGGAFVRRPRGARASSRLAAELIVIIAAQADGSGETVKRPRQQLRVHAGDVALRRASAARRNLP